MYILPIILIILCMIFLLLNYRRRQKIICKIRCMDVCEKQNLLNQIIHPFGFTYDNCEDIFSSTVDAWQHEFGYRTLFDYTASHFNMVFDCEPVYFNYNNQTWLIEFWKGQYGINTGAEIGVYYADEILTPKQYPYAQFHSASEKQMLPMSIKLEHHYKPLFRVQDRHWWLTGFRMGTFSQPKDLTMHISITFPHNTMMQSFIDSLQELGYKHDNFCICNNTLSFVFSSPLTKPQQKILHSLRNKLAQWMNHMFARLFCRITRPFSCTADRLLYLYYFLPFAFRHTVELRCSSRQKHRSLKKQFHSGRCHS